MTYDDELIRIPVSLPSLDGERGNAFGLVMSISQHLFKAERRGVFEEGYADRFREEAFSSNHDHLLRTIDRYVDCYFDGVQIPIVEYDARMRAAQCSGSVEPYWDEVEHEVAEERERRAAERIERRIQSAPKSTVGLLY